MSLVRRVDRSGPLRSGVVEPIETPKPLCEAEALPIIARFMGKRPPWAAREPFAVPPEMYETAEAEMRIVMKRRGFPLPVSKDLENAGVRNFMFNGVAIVMKDEA